MRLEDPRFARQFSLRPRFHAGLWGYLCFAGTAIALAAASDGSALAPVPPTSPPRAPVFVTAPLPPRPPDVHAQKRAIAAAQEAARKNRRQLVSRPPPREYDPAVTEAAFLDAYVGITTPLLPAPGLPAPLYEPGTWTPEVSITGSGYAEVDVRKAVARKLARFDHCTELLLYRGGMRLMSDVLLEWTIGPTGRPSDVRGEARDADFAHCVAHVIKRVEFPATAGDRVHVRYKLRFEPVQCCFC